MPSGSLQVIYKWKGDGKDGTEGALPTLHEGSDGAGIDNSDENAPPPRILKLGFLYAARLDLIKKTRSLYAVGGAVNATLVVPRGTLTVFITRGFHLLDPNSNAMSLVDPQKNLKMLLYSCMLLVSYLSAGCLFFLLVEGPNSTFATTPVVAATNSTPAIYPSVKFNTILDVIYYSICVHDGRIWRRRAANPCRALIRGLLCDLRRRRGCRGDQHNGDRSFAVIGIVRSILAWCVL